MKKAYSLNAAVEQYLHCRTELGFQLRSEGAVLRSLARYARQVAHRGPLTTALVLRWAQLPASANPVWWARRLEIVRRFACFWIHWDERTEVPPAGIFGSSHHRPAVHLYSSAEILALLEAAKGFDPTHPLTAAILRTLFGLLAATGLRISEALRLQWHDLDWPRGLLLVRHSKFDRSRQIPLHVTTLAALRDCQRQCRQSFPAATAVFITARGRPLSYDWVRHAFHTLRADLGWIHQPRPRLHDLRHTFAINCLIRWYQQDEDIGNHILGLSTYLGHRRVSDTYWYLSAVPQLLALARKRWEQQTRRANQLAL